MAWGLLNLIKAKWTASGRQVILKGDALDIETAILEAHGVIQVPNISWVDITSVKVPATADSPAAVLMSGFPNILHPGAFVNGGLTDGRYRKNVADAVMDFDVASNLWGTEKASQHYLIYALAGNADTVFTVKAMPFMRFASQTSQVITLRNSLNTVQIGYGFTTDELVGGKIYVISGTSAGLMRTITANNNNNTDAGTITYSGDALTMTLSDWFIVLPPGTNFRWLGDIFNNSSSNLKKFDQEGPVGQWIDKDVIINGAGVGVVEDIRIASPLATRVTLNVILAGDGEIVYLGHPGCTASNALTVSQATGVNTVIPCINIEFCKYWLTWPGGTAPTIHAVDYRYPAGRR